MTRSLILAVAVAAGCSFGDTVPPGDSGLDGLDLTTVAPLTVVPGSTLVVGGRAFVEPARGASRLVLRGSFDDGGGDRVVAAALPLAFVDPERMDAVADATLFAGLGAEGEFHGVAAVEVDSAVDGQTHRSREVGVTLELRRQLVPALDAVATEGVIFVNDAIQIVGDGLLLGGAEGTTFAVVGGCFASGATCVPLGPTRVAIAPAGPFDRRRGQFPFVPAIAGLRRGHFQGTVSLENRHAGGAVTVAPAREVRLELAEAVVQAVAPDAVSLGQYLFVRGGGFVGGDAGGLTLVRVVGTVTHNGAAPLPVDTIVVPEFVDGHTLRYVVNEDDDLGAALALRGPAGALAATLTPLVSYDGDDVVGAARSVALAIAPVKQVVVLDFTPQYASSLEAFGLRAVDDALRERIAAVVARDYATVNLEVRAARPDDFAIYAAVEIGGPDPNGLALLGYDNTPGKDVGNLRLHDRIGGVNAITQADGYPGYGGVFVESLFVFSAHPGGFVAESAADPRFDATFDPFRPDRGGEPVRAADLAGGLDVRIGDAQGCPAAARPAQIGCAVWVLGALIGSTVSHEIGHSLGLANPDGADAHLLGDQPGRLMEAGGGRPFLERAELLGVAPGAFCDGEYAYLRRILPGAAAADPTQRPACR